LIVRTFQGKSETSKCNVSSPGSLMRELNELHDDQAEVLNEIGNELPAQRR
jgi:hypothetical protein